MAKVVVTARVENVYDRIAADEGRLPVANIRAVEVSNAIVAPGAPSLSMPATLLARLGLQTMRSATIRTSAGEMSVRIFGTARLTIQGRDCPVDITELPDGCPVLIGQIPLEAMDFVVDMGQHALVGNPAHGGEHVIELY